MKPLNKALKYNNGHICKTNPTEVTVFYLDSSMPVVNHLRVGLDIEIKIATITQRRSKFWRLPTRASVGFKTSLTINPTITLKFCTCELVLAELCFQISSFEEVTTSEGALLNLNRNLKTENLNRNLKIELSWISVTIIRLLTLLSIKCKIF